MRRILLTGRNGQIGWELQRALATLGELIATDRREMDLADPSAIRRAIRDIQPSIVVNAATYSAVDQAESKPELAMAINGIAPGIMAEEAKRLGAAIVHYSTDYVFDGTKATPYTEEDRPNPLNTYGKTKWAGELAIQALDVPHLILRTSWVYGARGKNFLLTVLRLAKEQRELKMVADQIGAPTWCRTIAEATGQMLARCLTVDRSGFGALAESSGTYHLTASGETNWYGFAVAIAERAAPDFRRARIVPVNSSDYPSAVQRPANSRLSVEKLETAFRLALPDWASALTLCMEGSDR